MPQYEQKPLFDLDGVKQGETFGKRHYWYYLISRDGLRMVYGLDDQNNPLWCVRDTRPVTGVKPYLFNNRASAARYCRDHKLNAEIRKWHFSYK
jgi:hypothetical protein